MVTSCVMRCVSLIRAGHARVHGYVGRDARGYVVHVVRYDVGIGYHYLMRHSHGYVGIRLLIVIANTHAHTTLTHMICMHTHDA